MSTEQNTSALPLEADAYQDKLIFELGYSFGKSKTHRGEFRWLKNNGGDGQSVPVMECSQNFQSVAAARYDVLLIEGLVVELGLGVTLSLVCKDNGYMDYDVLGHGLVKRVCIGMEMQNGEPFNVYLHDGTKQCGFWDKNLTKSVLGALSLVKEIQAESGRVETVVEVGEEELIEEALNAACKAIQDRLGVKNGDVAGFYFSGANADAFKTLFKGYVEDEKRFLQALAHSRTSASQEA